VVVDAVERAQHQAWRQGSIRTHRVFLLCPQLEALLHPVLAHLLLRQQRRVAQAPRQARVAAVVAVVEVVVAVAAVAAPLFRPLVPRGAEASWWPGTPSLRKKHGVGEPAQVRASTPAGPSQLLGISCFPMSRIASLHSRPTPVSRFSTSQPEWAIPVLR
jgi:hypothetical protein